jgi:hypothetical protein
VTFDASAGYVVFDVITRETRDLRDAILAEARARGIDLEEESLVVEQSFASSPKTRRAMSARRRGTGISPR